MDNLSCFGMREKCARLIYMGNILENRFKLDRYVFKKN